MLANAPGIYFATPQFDGYPAVLVLLDKIGTEELEGAITESWLDRAPKRLTRAWLEERSDQADRAISPLCSGSDRWPLEGSRLGRSRPPPPLRPPDRCGACGGL